MIYTVGFFLLVAVLGGLGSALRLVLSRWQGTLPWGILMANILAATIATTAYFAFGQSFVSLVLVAGFAGGLSTFSAVSAQTFDYFKAGEINRMVFNALFQFGLPILATVVVAVVYLAGIIRPIGW
jgi:fluoride ion exporter CrcB/FEX